MATPLRPKTPVTRIKRNSEDLGRERRKPNMPGPYIYVCNGDPADLDPPVATWQSPSWVPANNFTWVGTSYFGFRHGLDGSTEFTGALDLTQGAVTGTVAFTLPVPYRNVFDPRFFPIDLGTGAWTAGILRMVTVLGPSYGDVIVEWPLQADLIP